MLAGGQSPESFPDRITVREPSAVMQEMSFLGRSVVRSSAGASGRLALSDRWPTCRRVKSHSWARRWMVLHQRGQERASQPLIHSKTAASSAEFASSQNRDVATAESPVGFRSLPPSVQAPQHKAAGHDIDGEANHENPNRCRHFPASRRLNTMPSCPCEKKNTDGNHNLRNTKQGAPQPSIKPPKRHSGCIAHVPMSTIALRRRRGAKSR